MPRSSSKHGEFESTPMVTASVATTRGDARDGDAVDRVRRRRVHALRLDPMNVAGALAGTAGARAADADPDLAVESAEPTAKAMRTKTAVSHRTVSHRREENGGVRHVVPRDLFAKALAKALDERRLSGDAPDDDERATSHRAGASHRATTKERASRSAHGVASRASKRRPDTTREKDAEKTSGSDASVALMGHVHRATSHRATSRAQPVTTGRRGSSARARRTFRHATRVAGASRRGRLVRRDETSSQSARGVRFGRFASRLA